jgi:phosphate transport system permease protein
MAILVTMIVILTIDAMPSITKFGFSFFTSQEWNAVTQEYGALPAIFGTLYSSLLGLLIAVPLSLGAAIFLVELAPPWIRGPGSFLIEMLAAIPSVIIGLWGLIVLVPVIRT